MRAVAILLGMKKNMEWKEIKKEILGHKRLLDCLANYDVDNISDAIIRNLRPIVKSDDFNYEAISKKSSTAAGLC